MRLLEWMLDLDRINLARDAPLFLKWNDRLAPWMLFAGALVAVSIVAVVYFREQLSLSRRLLMIATRCALLALVGAILCEPSLVLQRNRTEGSYLTLFVDRSQSMAANEEYADAALAEAAARGALLGSAAELVQHSRLDLVTRALCRDEGVPLKRLASRNAVQLAAFAEEVDVLGTFASPDDVGALVPVLQGLSATGPTTELGAALEDVLENTRGRRLAAIVLATDGQTNDPSRLKDALDLARGKQVPVYPVRVGSADARSDIDLGPVRAEPAVFVNDWLPIELRVAGTGLSGPTLVTVVLVDEASGTAATSRQVTIEPAAREANLELRVKPTRTGPARYRVEARPIPGETILDNNIDFVDVEVLSDRLRVLYVEGYPRFEYRYLKNALLREPGIELSVLLLEADEQFVQEGTDPIRRFPETREEMDGFDVVLFGDADVRGHWLSSGQAALLTEFVRVRGGGFGLIAGERSAPHSYLGTVMEKLVPIRIDPDFLGQYDMNLSSGFRPERTSEGRASRLLGLENGTQPGLVTEQTQSASEREFTMTEDVFESLPELYWLCRTLGPKPGATVLATHPTLRVPATLVGDVDKMPLLVSGRYGAGRVFFQATDDTWRWRRFRLGRTPAGEFLHDAYWVQLARMLAQPSRSPKGGVIVRTDKRVYTHGQPVNVRVEIPDTGLAGDQADHLDMLLIEAAADPSTQGSMHPGPRDGKQPASATGLPEQDATAAVGRFAVRRVLQQSGVFEGSLVPPGPGRFRIRLASASSNPEQRGSTGIRVESPRLEAPRLEADHSVLEQIASATGGKVIGLDELEAEFAAIRDRSVQTPDDIVEPLWDSKVVLVLFALMISAEWILRKGFGLQ